MDGSNSRAFAFCPGFVLFLRFDSLRWRSTFSAKCAIPLLVGLFVGAPSALAAPCPQGSEEKGASPPFGVEQWCQRPDGFRAGPYARWYPDGFQREVGSYAEGQKTGEWTYWHGNGQRAAVVHFVHGHRHGTFQTWDKNGHLKREGQFIRDQPHGVWHYYQRGNVGLKRFQNGELLKSLQVKVVCENGSQAKGNPPPTGTLQFCVDGTDQKQGQWVLWHKNGQVAETRSYVHGKLKGKVERFYANGFRRERGTYKAGKKDGLFESWNPDGVRSEERRFAAGHQEGPFVEFDENGQRRLAGEYHHGLRQGIWQQWASTGKLLGTLVFVDGDGQWQQWYDNGELKEQGDLAGGKRQGRWRTFRPDGWMEKETWYKKGRAIPAPQ